MIQDAPTKWSKSYSNKNVLDKSPRPETKCYGLRDLLLLRAYLLTKEIQFSPDFLRDVWDCLVLVGCHATSHCMQSNSSKSPLSRKSSERTSRLRRKLRFVYLRKAQPFYFGEEDHSISVKARVWQCAIYFAGILFNSLSFKNRYFFLWLCDSHIKKNKGSLFW